MRQLHFCYPLIAEKGALFMEQQTTNSRTFTWRWTSRDGRQEYSVSCDQFDVFLDSLVLISSLLPDGELTLNHTKDSSAAPAVPLPDTLASSNGQSHRCPIHGVEMKERKTRDGKTWWDHRWQDEAGTWCQCNGKQTRVNDTSKGAVS
jgi:hypothetical protein